MQNQSEEFNADKSTVQTNLPSPCESTESEFGEWIDAQLQQLEKQFEQYQTVRSTRGYFSR